MMHALIALGLLAPAASADSDADESLVGRTAPSWQVEQWMNSEPLALEDLRGSVVLVRWWTGPGCPFCTATAPALNEFHEEFKDDGLRVIGFYHHKSRRPFTSEDVAALAAGMAFEFPIAVDPDWSTLNDWWLKTGDRSFTSVSFLLDREGVIRYVHPGGQYVKDDGEYEVMRSQIESLLSEKTNRR